MIENLLWILFFLPPKPIVITVPTPSPAVISQKATKLLVEPVYSDNLVSVVNSKRSSYGLTKLTPKDILNKTAKWKACDMIEKNYWSHADPSGNESWETINKMGYKYQRAGENIARNWSNDQSIVDAWEKSPTHKDVMLDKDYKEIGIGRCKNIVVMHVGTRT